MIPPFLTNAYDTLKSTMAVAGMIGTGATFYVAAGFPVPATTAYVDSSDRRIETAVLHSARSITTLSKQFLRSDRANLMRLMEADPSSKATLERRTDEIDDSLAELERDSENIRKRLLELK